MPNGASAPGKVSPPFVVPMNGLTSDAGSETSAAAAGATGPAGAAPAAAAGKTRAALNAIPRTADDRRQGR